MQRNVQHVSDDKRRVVRHEKDINNWYTYRHRMVAIEESLCRIEILKDGSDFIARAQTQGGTKEYKNTIFEDLLRELFIDLQEDFGEL
jgi:hypothetical protein